MAREVEHLLASGELRPEQVCVIAGPAGREGRLVAAALEERNIPLRSVGTAAFFHRPEVRDAIAWLRALADPCDCGGRRPHADPAAGRAAIGRPRPLHDDRPPPQARHDLGASRPRSRARSSRPPSRDRLRAFLKLYRAAARALDASPRRRLRPPPDRAGRLPPPRPVRGQPGDRRAAGQPRRDSPRLAAAWTRRRPDGSTREFVRYLSAVAEAGQRFSRRYRGTARAAPSARRARPGQGA